MKDMGKHITWISQGLSYNFNNMKHIKIVGIFYGVDCNYQSLFTIVYIVSTSLYYLVQPYISIFILTCYLWYQCYNKQAYGLHSLALWTFKNIFISSRLLGSRKHIGSKMSLSETQFKTCLLRDWDLQLFRTLQNSISDMENWSCLLHNHFWWHWWNRKVIKLITLRPPMTGGHHLDSFKYHHWCRNCCKTYDILNDSNC